MQNIPCLLGEFGLPFDLNNKRAYKTGNFSLHEKALTLYYDAIDALLLSATIWNYTPDNSHERGDLWNGEDFSIWGPEGARAIAGWRRPYPVAIAGSPLSFSWDYRRKRLLFKYIPNPSILLPTEIYLPEECIGSSILCNFYDLQKQPVNNIRYEWDKKQSRLYIFTGQRGQELVVVIGSTTESNLKNEPD
jgi:hypothetical protein